MIVTDDNPRFEDPQQIMTEIVAGFEQPESVTFEHDRASCHSTAVSNG